MIFRLYSPDVLDAAIQEQASDIVRDGFTAQNWLSNPNHIALTDGRNITMFEAQEEPGLFYGHIIFRDRGKAALTTVNSMVSMLVDFFGAKRIQGEPRADHKAAHWFLRKLGFRSLGPKSTPYGDVEQFIMECSA